MTLRTENRLTRREFFTLWEYVLHIVGIRSSRCEYILHVVGIRSTRCDSTNMMQHGNGARVAKKKTKKMTDTSDEAVTLPDFFKK